MSRASDTASNTSHTITDIYARVNSNGASSHTLTDTSNGVSTRLTLTPVLVPTKVWFSVNGSGYAAEAFKPDTIMDVRASMNGLSLASAAPTIRRQAAWLGNHLNVNASSLVERSLSGLGPTSEMPGVRVVEVQEETIVDTANTTAEGIDTHVENTERGDQTGRNGGS